MTLKTKLYAQIKMQHLSEKTADKYWDWVQKFLRFHKRGATWKHPSEMGAKEVSQYLSWMANEKNVSAATQNNALCALVYLYRDVLDRELPKLEITWAKRVQNLPVWLSQNEVSRLLDCLSGTGWLIAAMQYGGGLRIGEAVKMRIKDVDIDRRKLRVIRGKGRKSRETFLPDELVRPITEQIEHVRSVWQDDRDHGRNGVSLPDAFDRKSSIAPKQFCWYYLFPSANESRKTRGDLSLPLLRHHVNISNVGRRFQAAVSKAGFIKRVTPHALRHSFATHLLEQGMDVVTICELMGHADLETTRRYLHALRTEGSGVQSPLSTLLRNPHIKKHRRKRA